MEFCTADLCDEFEDLSIVQPGFRIFGGLKKMSGQIVTIKTFEDNSKVRELVGTPGLGKVLVVDGGASMNCALLGDNLARMAVENQWQGIVINGCLRDSAIIDQMDLSVRALNTHPRKTIKRGLGDVNVTVSFSGVQFEPGAYLYADEDGIIVSSKALVETKT